MVYMSKSVTVENKIVNVEFSQDEVDAIYDHVNNTPKDQTAYQEAFGHTIYLSWLPEKIVDKIVKVANDSFGKKIILKELAFCRYANTTGKNPLLFPHYDETFKEQRVTFDIQLRATKPWAIVVEDKPYTLSDNEALFFSGTHQVHWREKLEFEETDYVDMIFCHFAEESPETTPEEHYQIMDAKVKHFRDQYYA
jgi:hypothetical protein